MSLTTKPGKTLLFTKECHNVDMLKLQRVADNMGIVTPERKKEIWQYIWEDMVVCHGALQYVSFDKMNHYLVKGSYGLNTLQSGLCEEVLYKTDHLSKIGAFLLSPCWQTMTSKCILRFQLKCE